MRRKLSVFARMALPVCLLIATAATAEEPQLPICNRDDEQRGQDFNPLSEAEKSMAQSRMAIVGGRALIAATDTAPLGQIVGLVGTLSGRTLIWFFEVSNPVAIALGYILVPTSTTNCDVEFSKDPICPGRQSCIAKLKDGELSP